MTGLSAQERPAPATPAGASQSSPAPRAQAATGADEQVTVTGCIQREADYRQATGAGRGGAAATGIGTGNEFILANAMMGAAAGTSPSGAATGTSGSAASATAGASGSTSAFELTGANEGQAAAHVGKRVQIMGKLKAGDAGAATGGPTAGLAGSQDLKLRELEVSSISETTGTCSAAR